MRNKSYESDCDREGGGDLEEEEKFIYLGSMKSKQVAQMKILKPE